MESKETQLPTPPLSPKETSPETPQGTYISFEAGNIRLDEEPDIKVTFDGVEYILKPVPLDPITGKFILNKIPTD